MLNQLPSLVVLLTLLVAHINLIVWLKFISLRYENLYLNNEELEDTDYEDQLVASTVYWTDVLVVSNGLTVAFIFGLVIGGYIQ